MTGWFAGLIAASAALFLMFGSGPVQAGEPGKPPPADSSCHRDTPPIIRDGFPQLQHRYSRNGRLDLKLTAKWGKAKVDGKQVWARTYNGQFPGPMWMICSGDQINVDLVNRLRVLTNLHTHGFHVSPRRNHDNIFVNVKPGESFRYQFTIPKTQSPGSYWYHPHRHHLVTEQMFRGMAGTIVQQGGLDRHPILKDVPQRMIVLQNSELTDGRMVSQANSTPSKQQIFVNGELNPTAKIRPGELQRWRIFNASADRMLVLRLGGRPFWVVAQDANILDRPRKMRNLKLAPGQRREVLVRGGKNGKYTLVAERFKQFTTKPRDPQPFMFVRSQGSRVKNPIPIPRRLGGHREDLRKVKPERYRQIRFSDKQVGDDIKFLLNGKTYDPKQVLTMKMDSVEQWKLVNETSEWHTFHIHINDFQVLRVSGNAQKYVNYQDNVMIPPNSSVLIRQRPTQFAGKFVFHCHVILHEDSGMMAAVQVKRSPTAAELNRSSWQDDDFTVTSSEFGAKGPPVEPIGTNDAFPPGGDQGWSESAAKSTANRRNPFICKL